MAKNSGIIQFTGKLGELVGAQGQDGRTIIRQRRYTIKNPKTDAQCAQRMIFATAGQAIAHLKPILNNSFEGKSFGAKSIQYARSLYLRMLRTAPSLDNNGMVYLPKGSLNFPANAYPLSQGSLPSVQSSASLEQRLISVDSNATEATMATVTAANLFPQVAVGHQMTFVVADVDNYGKSGVQICRFAFKDNTAPALISSDSGYKLNPAAIDASLAEGKWDQLVFSSSLNAVVVDMSAMVRGALVGYSIIISDKINGKRSSETLIIDEDSALETRGGMSAAEALPTYADGASSLNLPSDYYLQNSVSVAE